jgi:formylglycine-generating enzyme required for sulfatase activity
VTLAAPLMFAIVFFAATLMCVGTGRADSVLPLSPERERSLKPKDVFKEYNKCPETVVVPAGSFTMGSPASEAGRQGFEGPQHRVNIAARFAVGKVQVTVDQFAAFIAETGYVAGSKCWTFEGGKWAAREERSWSNPGFPQAIPPGGVPELGRRQGVR